jgi:DNA-binding CsgD family transcriptional regulator
MMMNDSPLERLTERQRQLLELVNRQVSRSKEIAKETGLAPGSIDTLLQNAAKTLGERDRKSAARRYAELIDKSQHSSQLRQEALETEENQALSEFAAAPVPALRKFLRFFKGPPLGGSSQHLRWDQIALQTLRVAAIGMVSIWALVLFVLGFFQTFGGG